MNHKIESKIDIWVTRAKKSVQVEISRVGLNLASDHKQWLNLLLMGKMHIQTFVQLWFAENLILMKID